MATETTFGVWLRQQRRQMDWTQVELAQRVGYSVATIRKLERDELRPSKHLAELLAHELDVALTHHASLVNFARCTPTPQLEPDVQPQHAQRRSNLTAQLTPFFGRTAEIIELTQYLTNPATRLITIVGPGGMGKTRLALEVAQAILGLSTQTDLTDNPKSEIVNRKFSDGVYFVALAPLRAPEHIVPAIAEAITLRFQAGNRLPRQQLLDYLRYKQLLLVLDNFEHLVAGAELILELLQACPGLRLLVTPREHLKLNSETRLVLESLALPFVVTLPDVLSYSAVQLFVETACRLRPKFTVTPANAQAIVHICQLVGAMPLGIILAAAWVEVLSPAEIVTELSQGFDFLAAELHDLPERQRSMRAVLTQSWQRLTDAERAVFMRLAVFRGGFTRPAAQSVAGASLRMISSLVNKSLVQCEPSGRYTIHELLRQFAEAELAAANQTADVHARHLAYFSEIAAQITPQLGTTRHVPSLRLLEHDIDNFRAALTWSLQNDRGEQGVKLALALLGFWLIAAYRSEGDEWMNKLLSMGGCERWPLPLQAQAQMLSGDLAFVRSDAKRARRCFEQSMQHWQALNDRKGIAEGLRRMGLVEKAHHTAQRYFEQSLLLFRELDDKAGIATTLAELGYLVSGNTELTYASALFEESLVLYRQIDNKFGAAAMLRALGIMAYQRKEYNEGQRLYNASLAQYYGLESKSGIADLLNDLGDVALHLSDYAQAWQSYQEGLLVSVEIDSKWGIAWSFVGLARVAQEEAKFAEAVQLFGVSQALFDEIDMRLRQDDQKERDDRIGLLRQELGEAAFARAWAQGRTMPLLQAVRLVTQSNIFFALHTPPQLGRAKPSYLVTHSNSLTDTTRQ